MHTDIVTVNRDNQILVSSIEVAQKFGKRHADVLRNVHEYLKNENLNDFNKRNFALAPDVQNGRARRGRPRLAEVFMSRDGFALVAMGFTGKKALEWKLKFLNAFSELEHTVLGEIPKLKQRIFELESETSRKALPGSRTGMISAPVLTSNLWGDEEIVGWELRPKDTLDDYLLTLANLRHCNLVAEGLEEKKRRLTDTLVNEELNRRATVTDLTERRFKLPRSKKDN